MSEITSLLREAGKSLNLLISSDPEDAKRLEGAEGDTILRAIGIANDLLNAANFADQKEEPK